MRKAGKPGYCPLCKNDSTRLNTILLLSALQTLIQYPDIAT
jgi:hypothetical protein